MLYKVLLNTSCNPRNLLDPIYTCISNLLTKKDTWIIAVNIQATITI